MRTPSTGGAAFVVRGALGFAAVSVAAFSVWAFGARWFRGYGGEAGMYAAIAVVFVLLTGLLLHPLVRGEHRVRRFYAAFAPAFLAYALVWSGFWFWLKFGYGEWLGALVGSLAFVGLLAWRFGRWRRFGWATTVFFGAHTIGYFAGGKSMALLLGLARQDPVLFLSAPSMIALAKLSWGLLYGFGFGAGMGYTFYVLQCKTHFLESRGVVAPPGTTAETKN